MLPHLVDLESRYDPELARPYDPRDLIRYALELEASEYWAERAVDWLDQGAPGDGLGDALLAVEERCDRSQSLRHRARRIRKAL